ncbi:MAG: TetR/AcrR family transcriptional regulator [Pseudomonadota bacterium]
MVCSLDQKVHSAYIIRMGEVLKLKRGDLRNALVDYALDAARDGHIEVMSLRQAARDLGVSSGAVYRHFSDKDALLMEMVRLGFFDVRERFLRIRPEGAVATSKREAIDRCFQLARTYIEFAHENAALWHMMFGRVGMLCRTEIMQDPELARYTPFDVCVEINRDLYRAGLLLREPTLSDVRYQWSATHGAADLTQSGARLDHQNLDQIIMETVHRNLLSVGIDLEKLSL